LNRIPLVVTVGLAVLALAPRAAASDPTAAFHEATGLAARGEHKVAVARLLGLADEHPTHELADDALLKAAQLSDERLRAPQQALSLYRRLAVDYPQSRVARRAQLRADAIAKAIGATGQHAAAYAEFQRVRARPTLERSSAIDEMRAFVATYPASPVRPAALLWLANVSRAEGRMQDAQAYYQDAIEARDSDVAKHARKGLADVLLAVGEFQEADAAYRAYIRTYPSDEQLIAQDLTRLNSARQRARVGLLAWLVVAIFVIGMLWYLRGTTGSWRELGRTLATPPAESIYLCPVLAALFLGALASNALAYRAMLFFSLGAVVISWFSGAALERIRRHQPPKTLRTLTIGGAAALATAAVVYLALTEQRLLDLLAETLKHGPDH